MVSPIAASCGLQRQATSAHPSPDISSALPSSGLRRLLLGYADRHAGADGFAALADGKALLLLHRDRRDQLHVHGRVVARHDHLCARRQRALPGHIRGPEVKLRTVVVEERRVPAAPLPGPGIRPRLELLLPRPPTPPAPKPAPPAPA